MSRAELELRELGQITSFFEPRDFATGPSRVEIQNLTAVSGIKFHDLIRRNSM